MGRMKRRASGRVVFAIAAFAVSGRTADAQEQNADEIAREPSNPTSTLMSLNALYTIHY